MKKIRKVISIIGILVVGLLSAQDSKMNNMIKVGLNAGLALPANNASASLGVDFAYQNLVTPGFGLGIATGYSHFFGKENKGYRNNDFGLVPIAAMVRFYPKQIGFYFGTDLGYGFLTGDDRVAENSLIERPYGGFYIKPEIGYHNQDWNFAIQYSKVFTGNKGDLVNQKYSVASLGVGVSYNLPLGK